PLPDSVVQMKLPWPLPRSHPAQLPNLTAIRSHNFPPASLPTSLRKSITARTARKFKPPSASSSKPPETKQAPPAWTRNPQTGPRPPNPNRRDEISGVSLDEEITNMLQFQRAFQAASRVFNVMDEMLRSLVNELGNR